MSPPPKNFFYCVLLLRHFLAHDYNLAIGSQSVVRVKKKKDPRSHGGIFAPAARDEYVYLSF